MTEKKSVEFCNYIREWTAYKLYINKAFEKNYNHDTYKCGSSGIDPSLNHKWSINITRTSPDEFYNLYFIMKKVYEVLDNHENDSSNSK